MQLITTAHTHTSVNFLSFSLRASKEGVSTTTAAATTTTAAFPTFLASVRVGWGARTWAAACLCPCVF